MSFGPPPPPPTSPSPYTQSTLAVGARKKRRTVLLLTVILALTATLFGGGWALWHLTGAGDDDGARASTAQQPPDAVRETVERVPKTPEGQVAVEWAEKLKEGRRASTKGTWVAGSIAAKSFANVIRGIEIGTAQEKWEVEFAGPLCAVTRHVSVDGRTVVAVPGKRPERPERPEKGEQPEATPCDHLAVVDIDSGKKLWEKPLPDGGGDSTGVNVTMTRGTVVATWGQGSAAYDMTTGKRFWADLKASTCTDVGFAGGRGLLALRSCGDSADPEFRVQKVAPRTGRTVWTHKVARGIDSVYLASSQPPVIAVATGNDGTIDYLHSLDDDRGRNRATIPLPERRYLHNCDESFSAEVERCSGVVVGERQLYMATKPRDMYEAGLSRKVPNEIVAFDLGTGKTVLKFDAKHDRPMYPVRMSGGKVIAYRESAGGALSSVVRLDPGTGKEKLLLVLPDSTDRPSMDLFADSFDIVYEHGTVVFGMREVARQSGEQDEGPQVTLMDGYESSG